VRALCLFKKLTPKTSGSVFLNLPKNLKMNLIYPRVFIFFVACTATLGSLYFSEIRYFVPCILCWYQRICMYPLVIISFLNLFSKDQQKGERYVFPLSLIGMGIALFHFLLEHKWLGLDEKSCFDNLCSVVWVKYFNIFTIPTLSLLAFTLINLTLVSFFLKIKPLNFCGYFQHKSAHRA